MKRQQKDKNNPPAGKQEPPASHKRRESLVPDGDDTDLAAVRQIVAQYVDNAPRQQEKGATNTENMQEYLVLEVEDLQNGLKRASQLLGLPIDEISFTIQQQAVIETDGTVTRPYTIRYEQKRLSGPIECMVSLDKMNAYVKTVFPKDLQGNTITVKRLQEELRKIGVISGIKQDVLQRSIETLASKKTVLTDVLVAEGALPVPGPPAKPIFSLLPASMLESKGNRTTSGLDFLMFSNEEEVLQNAVAAYIVVKDESILEVSLHDPGVEGCNVFGEPITSAESPYAFRCGENVRMETRQASMLFIAEKYGYAEIAGGEITVWSPIWIQADRMEVCYIALAPQNRMQRMSYEELVDELSEKGIKYGINDAALRKVADKDQEFHFPQAVTLAQGEPPIHGEDARIEFFFNVGDRYGRVREDGSIDFKESGLIATVGKGQLLAVKYLPTAGKPGKNVRGQEAPSQAGTDVEFIRGDNVRIVQQENKELFYSEIDGRVQVLREKQLIVNPVVTLKGNVDYSTGNIDFQGDVEVNGSVQSGFRICAAGGVVIKGIVNPGVHIEAGGDVIVGQGVIGRDNTTIISKGNVSALYFQNARIQADGDVIFRRYILNSTIKCGGRVMPPEELGDKIQGSIIGGEILASKEVKSKQIGSDVEQKTKIIVGVDWLVEQELASIEEAVSYCTSIKQKILRSNRFLLLGDEKLRDTLKKLPGVKQQALLADLQKLQDLKIMEDDLRGKRDAVAKKLHLNVQHANIVVRDILYPNVFIQIGDVQMKIEQELSKVRLFADQEHKRIKTIKFMDF